MPLPAAIRRCIILIHTLALLSRVFSAEAHGDAELSKRAALALELEGNAACSTHACAPSAGMHLMQRVQANLPRNVLSHESESSALASRLRSVVNVSAKSAVHAKVQSAPGLRLVQQVPESERIVQASSRSTVAVHVGGRHRRRYNDSTAGAVRNDSRYTGRIRASASALQTLLLAHSRRASDKSVQELPTEVVAGAAAVAALGAVLSNQNAMNSLKDAANTLGQNAEQAAEAVMAVPGETAKLAGDLVGQVANVFSIGEKEIEVAVAAAAKTMAATLEAADGLLSQGIFSLTKDTIQQEDSVLTILTGGWNSVAVGVVDLGWLFGQVLLNCILDILRNGANPIVEVAELIVDAFEFASDPLLAEDNRFADAIAKAANGMNMPGTLPKDQRLDAEWPSMSTANYQFVSVVLLLLLSAGCAVLIEWAFPVCKLYLNGLDAWKAALWVASYMLLVPGLTCTFFRYSMAYSVMGVRWSIFAQPPDFNPTYDASIFEVVRQLWESRLVIGCLVVLFFSAALPIVKLAFVVRVQVLAKDPNPEHEREASRLLTSVHLMSKWICTDVLGYVLIMSLYRDCQVHDGVDADSQLGFGFVCFSLSCFCTALLAGTHAWNPPVSSDASLSADGREDFSAMGNSPTEAPCEQQLVFQDLPSYDLVRGVIKSLEPRGIFRLSLVMLAVFLATIASGSVLPCLRLTTEMQADVASDLSQERADVLGLKSPEDMLPPLLTPIAASFNETQQEFMGSLLAAVEAKIYATISLSRCLESAWMWVIRRGDVSSLLVVVLFAGFVLLATMLDMFVLTVAAWQYWMKRPTKSTMSLAPLLKRASMLDVCIVSVALMRWAGVITVKEGGRMHLQSGFLLLVLAEMLHNLTFHLVTTAIRMQDVSATRTPPVRDCGASKQ